MLKLAKHLVESGAAAAGQIHHQPNTLAVHDRQHLRGGGKHRHRLSVLRASTGSAGPAQVRVDVDHRKARPLDFRLCNPKHAGGLIVIQRKRAALG